MSKQVADALREARKLIDKPEKWCQSAFSEPGRGGVRRHCAFNAVVSAVPTELVVRCRDALIAAIPGSRIGLLGYNDDEATGWEDIMALYGRAIAAEDTTP